MKGFCIRYKDSRLPHLDYRTHVSKGGIVEIYPSMAVAQKERVELLKKPYVSSAIIVDSENLDPVPDQEFSSSPEPTPQPPSIPAPIQKAAPAPKRAICPDCGRPMPKKRSKKE